MLVSIFVVWKKSFIDPQCKDRLNVYFNHSKIIVRIIRLYLQYV